MRAHLLKLSRSRWIILVGAAMTLALVGAVLSRAATVAAAPEITMEVEGYDPRAMLLGHYVQIRLIPSEVRFAADPKLENGGDVWVRLRPGTAPALWEVAGVAPRRPALAAQERAVRARLLGPYEMDAVYAAQLDYGVDRIYVGQAVALRIEEILAATAARPERVHLVLALSDGRLMPKAVIVGKERIPLATLT